MLFTLGLSTSVGSRSERSPNPGPELREVGLVGAPQRPDLQQGVKGKMYEDLTETELGLVRFPWTKSVAFRFEGRKQMVSAGCADATAHRQAPSRESSPCLFNVLLTGALW